MFNVAIAGHALLSVHYGVTTSFLVTQPEVAFPTHRATLENTSAGLRVTIYSSVKRLTGTNLYGYSVQAGLKLCLSCFPF
jgi:hypothetical protein